MPNSTRALHIWHRRRNAPLSRSESQGAIEPCRKGQRFLDRARFQSSPVLHCNLRHFRRRERFSDLRSRLRLKSCGRHFKWRSMLPSSPNGQLDSPKSKKTRVRRLRSFHASTVVFERPSSSETRPMRRPRYQPLTPRRSCEAGRRPRRCASSKTC